jgi:hypothetical protein
MPGFKTFTSAVLTSSDVNSFLMRQSVVQCTSATRPATVHDGMLIYETDTERFMFYEQSDWRILAMRAWASRTPTVSNFGIPGVNQQWWRAVGKSVLVCGEIRVGASTSIGATPIRVDLPFTPATHGNLHYIGSAFYFRQSDSSYYVGTAFIYPPGGSTITFVHTNAAVGGLANFSTVGNNPGFTLGTVGDGILYQVEYEVA